MQVSFRVDGNATDRRRKIRLFTSDICIGSIWVSRKQDPLQQFEKLLSRTNTTMTTPLKITKPTMPIHLL